MASPPTSIYGGSDQPPERKLMMTQTAGNLGETASDNDVIPPSLVEIASILRVANEVEKHNPRVAYLCRFYTFEKAHQLDPTSRGCGVRQFKTALLQRLEKDNELTLTTERVKGSDAKEMQNFYQNYMNLSKDCQTAQPEKDRQAADVLFEVLMAVNGTKHIEVDGEIAPDSKSEMATNIAPNNEVAENS